MKLYMRTTTDHLELPLAVAASPRELASMLGTSEGNVLTNISHGRRGWLRIEVEDEDLELCPVA